MPDLARCAMVWWNKRSWSRDAKLTQEPISDRDRLSANQMEFPLVVLAFLAITAGFIGIHEDILGQNVLHDFLAPTLLHHPEAIAFDITPMVASIVVAVSDITPMVASIVVAVSGLTLGWWVYGRRPLAAGVVDPTEQALGPGVWTMLQNRFYIDILYRRYLLRPAEWFAVNIVIQAIDKETIDGVLETVGETFVFLGETFKRFNTVVIDGVGDGIPGAIGDFAAWFRQSQTGRVQQYLLVATLALLAIGTLFLIQVR